ncbi:MAG: hypothetical protein ABJB05_02495, partial [Parafilimonas sp.]
MKKLILPFFILLFISCDSKKESIIDSQKVINKQLTGLEDSLKRVNDSTSHLRMKNEVRVLQLRFDSLS